MFREVYKLLLEIYLKIRPLRIKMLFVGTKAYEDYWASRGKGDDWGGKTKNTAKAHWESKNHPHRHLLVEAVSKFNPKSILEVGCASGQNLYLLARKYPKAQIWGIDINKNVVEFGNKQFKRLGMGNVRLAIGKADELLFAKDTFDVVITDGLLIYIGKDKIRKVTEGLLAIAKRGLVLVEWHRVHMNGLGVYRNGLWQRNYITLLGRYEARSRITVDRIPKSVWKEWDGRGAIIEVRL